MSLLLNHQAFLQEYTEYPSISAFLIFKDTYNTIIAQAKAEWGDDLPIHRPQYVYMLINNDCPDRYNQIGKRASLHLNGLLYYPDYSCLVGLVRLQKNFTCQQIPHIVLSYDPKILNRIDCNCLINNKHIAPLVGQCNTTLKGKIGILAKWSNEYPSPDYRSPFSMKIPKQGRLTSESTTESLEEVEPYHYTSSIPIELPAEEVQLREQKKQAQRAKWAERTIDIEAQRRRTAEIERLGAKVKAPRLEAQFSVERSVNVQKPREEYFNGYLIHTGTRGGKYIIKGNRKHYLRELRTKKGTEYTLKLL